MHVYAVPARLVVGCVLLSAVAGCGGDPPTPPPFTPATSSTSPTPTGPVEPVLPEAAQEPTEAGAKAFAEFYWTTAINYAQATGDTGLIRHLSASTCVACDGGADAIEDIYGRHGVIEGGEYTVTRLKAIRLASSPPRYLLTFTIHNTKQVVDFPGRDHDGGFDPTSSSVRFIADFLNERWVAARWEVGE